MRSLQNKPVLNQSGQAVIEYMLLLVTTVMIVSIIGIGFRKTLFKMWTKFTQDITAGCPGCPPNEKYRIR